MDIAGVSMALANVTTQSQVSTAVLGKAMDTNKELGEGLVQMMDAAAMEQSVNPGIGANIDMRI
ncbi:MAG: YjfB family protein [Butyrivibrio sp.]|nr:YjfB family protein [Acetatifactor muris]MCM1559220.1 YjfB family protein [Butyrivibrio sp.]